MSFEKDYKEILAYATYKVNSQRLSLDPNDLINDAYLKLFDKPYCINNYKKEINNISIIEFHNKGKDVSFGTRSTKWADINSEQCCKICKQIKPSSEFYLVKDNRSGKPFIRGCCKICYIKQRAKYPPKKSGKEVYQTRKTKLIESGEYSSFMRSRNRYERKRRMNKKLMDMQVRKERYEEQQKTDCTQPPIFLTEYSDWLKRNHDILESRRTA